ncbi:hypothetical protein ACTHS8_08760 [Neisseria sp. P0016.S008]
MIAKGRLKELSDDLSFYTGFLLEILYGISRRFEPVGNADVQNA